MGNTTSVRSRRQNQGPRYLDHPETPLDVKLMIAAQLCPYCSIEEDAIPTTENARYLQRALANLGATCKDLYDVADQHRFHSFVMPYDPNFDDRRRLRDSDDLDQNIALARRFKNNALPELLDRIITDPDDYLGKCIKYLSIRDFTLQFKSGVTKPILGRFMATSLNLGIPIPAFIPPLLTLPEQTRTSLTAGNLTFWLDGQLWLRQVRFGSEDCEEFDAWLVKLLLFGSTPRLQKLMMDPEIAKSVFYSRNPPAVTLPSVNTMGIPERKGSFPSFFFRQHPVRFHMEGLLRSFPNLLVFQNDEAGFSWKPYPLILANSPPLFPNLRRLVLAVAQPKLLQYLAQVLSEFSQLEELFFHRLEGKGLYQLDPNVPIHHVDPNFSNADVFNSVHHGLRRLTYCSTMITHSPEYDHDYWISIECFEEENFSDVPHFGAFQVLEDLTIDQALLGRMSTVHDRVTSPTGPHFPDLDYRLPQTLCRLTIRYVYDWPILAAQLIAVARAKQLGLFPSLTDIFVVLVRTCTAFYRGVWPPQIPLMPSADIIRDSGEIMRAAGINLWASTADIDPPPGAEDYPHDAVPTGTLIAIDVRRRFFGDVDLSRL